MGKIIGTCGHEISLDWFMSQKGAILVKDKDRERQDCVSSLVVCPQCLIWYEKLGIIIKKYKEESWPESMEQS